MRDGVTGLLAVALVLGAGACDTGSRTGTTSTKTSETSSSVIPEVTTTSPPQTSVATTPQPAPAATAAEIRIVATVAATFASARVIQLADPVQGYSEVAFTSATRYRRSSGQAATLAEIQPGSRIEVRGTRGSAAALLAREVVLLG